METYHEETVLVNRRGLFEKEPILNRRNSNARITESLKRRFEKISCTRARFEVTLSCDRMDAESASQG